MPSRFGSRAVISALAALALALPVGLAVTSASSGAPRQTIVYDALGDSYASGYGVPPYETCGRSQSAYAVQVDGRATTAVDDLAACAGATTKSLVSGGQLESLDDETDLVTLQIGGNDIGWSSAVVGCLTGADPQCAAAQTATRQAITDALPGHLDSVYTQVAEKAPDAEVLVVGYPRLFSPRSGAYLGASPAEQQELNEGADLLNAVITEAAERHGFDFVDVTKRFNGHGVNAPEPWILGLLDPGAFHPNADGYQAYTAAVTAAVKPSLLR